MSSEDFEEIWGQVKKKKGEETQKPQEQPEQSKQPEEPKQVEGGKLFSSKEGMDKQHQEEAIQMFKETATEEVKESQETVEVETPETIAEPLVEEQKPTPAPVKEEQVGEGLFSTETPVETAEVLSSHKPSPPPAPEVPGPVEAPKPDLITPPREMYDTSPDRGSPKTVYAIYAKKGEGKTTLALSFPGKIACLSFDRKTVQVWEEMYKRAPRIVVFDAIRYLNKTTAVEWLKTANETLKYCNVLLEGDIRKFEPDWILIDGTEIFTQLCEMVMRFRNGLQPFQGIANRNLWKERRMLIDQLHNKCIEIAKQGVIYTTYTQKDEIIKDGQFIVKKDVPKWLDVIMYYTDVLIRTRSGPGKQGGWVFTATVENSKTKKMRTGKRVNITNGGYKTIVSD